MQGGITHEETIGEVRKEYGIACRLAREADLAVSPWESPPRGRNPSPQHPQSGAPDAR